MSEMKISPTDDCAWLNEDCTLMIDGDTPKEAEIAAGKINNHDRMVEEIAELREALPVIKQMIFSMKTNAHTFSNENVEEVSREGRSAMRLIDKLLAKLNQKGEE